MTENVSGKVYHPEHSPKRGASNPACSRLSSRLLPGSAIQTSRLERRLQPRLAAPLDRANPGSTSEANYRDASRDRHNGSGSPGANIPDDPFGGVQTPWRTHKPCPAAPPEAASS